MVSPASGARVATLQGIQEALPVTCGAPGLDWPRGDLQSQALPSAGLPARASSTLVARVPSVQPLVLFCLCSTELRCPA